jgi:hypothetical protein
LQPIGLHPSRNIVNAGGHAALEQIGGSRSAETEDLCVISVEVWQQTMVSD